jgi:alpha-L-fucosidase
MEGLQITGVTLASFTAPSNGMVVINKRLPILEGDEIVYLASKGNGNDAGSTVSLPWTMDVETGQTTSDVSAVQSGIEQGEFAWAFEVRHT